jgi:hypothetical protein
MSYSNFVIDMINYHIVIIYIAPHIKLDLSSNIKLLLNYLKIKLYIYIYNCRYKKITYYLLISLLL